MSTINKKKFAPVKALPHTPPYKIHRYFARRPWNLFEALIDHYSEPGDVILDPFVGGGVTAYEGIKSNRKVIACDINPLSNYIVANMFTSHDIKKLDQAVENITKSFKVFTDPSFLYVCEKCSSDVEAEWHELTYIVECPDCEVQNTLLNENKIRNGVYKCMNTKCWNHQRGFSAARVNRVGHSYLSAHGKCPECSTKLGKIIDNSLLDRNRQHASELAKLTRRKKLTLPLLEVPIEWDRQKEDLLLAKGVKYFQDFYTKKNLHLNYVLLDLINECRNDAPIYKALRFVFSDSVRDTNIMTFTNDSWQNGSPTSWAKHAYWLPSQFCEVNPGKAFQKSYKSFRKCVEYNINVGIDMQLAKTTRDFKKSANLLLRTGKIETLKLPANSVDAIITDPPYGSNVQYLELSHFWYMWNRDLYENNDIDFASEAIVNRKRSIKNAKTYQTYEDNLYQVFSEGNRLLKNGGNIVMTFNNKDINSWLALLISVFRAGFHFELGGITFQDGVSNYRQTAHTKAKGSPYGDFVYEFVKLSEKQYKTISTEDKQLLTDKILNQITRAIEKYENGEDRNTILVELFNEIVPEIEMFVKGAEKDGYLYDLYSIFKRAHLEPLYA